VTWARILQKYTVSTTGTGDVPLHCELHDGTRPTPSRPFERDQRRLRPAGSANYVVVALGNGRISPWARTSSSYAIRPRVLGLISPTTWCSNDPREC